MVWWTDDSVSVFPVYCQEAEKLFGRMIMKKPGDKCGSAVSPFLSTIRYFAFITKLSYLKQLSLGKVFSTFIWLFDFKNESNSSNVVSSLSSNVAINTFPTQARLPFIHKKHIYYSSTCAEFGLLYPTNRYPLPTTVSIYPSPIFLLIWLTTFTNIMKFRQTE